jgi:hypothetical protein
MRQLFEELKSHLTPEEKYAIFIPNPDYWDGFNSIPTLIIIYKIELPK